MKARSAEETLLVRYLLGDCSDQEKVQIEERFFASDEIFEQVCAIEEELIDQYLRGELSERERNQFEGQYGRAPRRNRVAFSRAINRLVPPSLSPVVPHERLLEGVSGWQRLQGWFQELAPSFRLSLAAATLLFVSGLSWLTWQTVRLHSSLENLQAERQQLQQQQEESQRRLTELQKRSTSLAEELRRELESSAQMQAQAQSTVHSLMASFVLSPGLVRGTDEPTRIVIPRLVQQVRLQLDLETIGNYKSYRAELRTAGGNLVWSQDMLAARSTDWGRAVSLTLPAEMVNTGEHELTLRGVVSKAKFEDVGYYYFSILKR